MKKLTVLASLAFATHAFAMDTTMDLKGRFDYLNTSSETNGGVKVTSGEYKPTYLKWRNVAKFNPTMTADLTLNLAGDSGLNTHQDNFKSFVDTAAVTKVLGRGFSAIVGKQPVLIGGRENDYSLRDIYLYSQFAYNIPVNQIGLTAQYDIAEQSFYIQHLENDAATTHTDKKIMGVSYYGNFMGGMLAPIISYHKFGTDRSHKYDVYTAAGLRLNSGAFIVEADYLMLTQEQVTGADKKLNSMVAHVRYNHEMYKPFVKYIMETGKDAFSMVDDAGNAKVGGAGVTKSERNAWEVGLEVVPNKDEDMRYHVVYNSSEMKDKTGGTNKFKENKIYAGLAFAYNILK